MKSLADMLDAASRELAMRRSVYPRRVAEGKMSVANAQHETECMEGIVDRLEMLKMLSEVSEEMKRQAQT